MQRLRLTFRRGEEIKYISHLDLMRAWERALRRARVPLAYSQGFNPHPRLVLAAPLSVGVVGEREILDLVLDEPLEPTRFLAEIGRQLPDGLEVLETEEVELHAPSLPATVRAAEYVAELRIVPSSPPPPGEAPPAGQEELRERSVTALEARVEALLQATKLPRERRRDKDIRRYDLRPLILGLRAERAPGGVSLWMLLRADSSGTGRPDEVLAALGIPPEEVNIRRLRLVLADND